MERAKQEKMEVQRFTRLQRILHILMIVSFLSLALTGMTLKFAYTKWAYILSHILGGFESTGFIHRFAAVIMLGVFVTHLINLYRSMKKENKSVLQLIFGQDSMMFNKKDWLDFKGSMKWFLGKGERPDYGRWTYWEKFDYFAVFWGIFVIGSTGMSLWFPEFFTRFFPGWVINVATIIHSDEALLATGFIFTVHFFNTHLRPEKFPMDIVIFTGRIDLDEFEIERPAEYKRLKDAGELDNYMVEPYQPIVIRAIKFFGWAALSIGFSIIIWIIYAMLFVYR
ncbi:MAG: cytochrome b/b6 domain-containing protein [Ignavibacteriaceae bacterium]